VTADLKGEPGRVARRFGVGSLLVVGQLAVSLALVAAGGLFVRGAIRAAAANPGFALDHQLVVAVDPSVAGYDETRGRALFRAMLQRVREEEEQEKHFTWSDESTAKLKRYMDDIYFLRLLYRRGIGWRLTTSGREFFYRPRSHTLEEGIPADHDFFISVPDKVLDDALTNGVLTDLGITLFVRIDTKIANRLSYLFFILMMLRDYGHFKSLGEFAHYVRFYLPFVFPKLFRLAPKGSAQRIALESASPAPLRAAS